MAYWPRVVDALVALLPTLPGFGDVPVYDGKPITKDAPLRYATVGYVHPDEDTAGSYVPGDAPVDRFSGESGEVRCQFVARTGDADLPTVRAQAFSMVDALAASLDTDPLLGGVLPPGSTCTLAVDVLPERASGTAQRLNVTVAYFARI